VNMDARIIGGVVAFLYLFLRNRFTLWGAPGFSRLQQKYGVASGLILLVIAVASCIALDQTPLENLANFLLLFFIGDLCQHFLFCHREYMRPDRTSKDSDRLMTILIVQLVLFTVLTMLLIDSFQPYFIKVQGTRLELLYYTAILVFPLWTINYLPPWFAWRILRHVKAPILYRFVFWFTPGIKYSDIHYFHLLVRALRGGNPLRSMNGAGAI